MKSKMKKALLAADVAFSAVKIAGIVAEHPEHNPCECPEHCLGCLF